MHETTIPAIVALQRGGNFVEAERQCRVALARDPDAADLLLLLAMSLHFQGRVDDALPFYRRLADLVPPSPIHWSNYATALAEAGRLGDAEAAWHRVIDLDPRNVDARIRAGLLLIARKDYLAAREMLLDAFELDRHSATVRIHAARACALAHDFRGAEDLIGPWRQWLPLHDDPLQLELAQQLMPLGRTPDARDLLAEMVARNPGYLEARVLLAKVEERYNRLDAAERLLQAIDLTSATQSLRQEILQLQATLLLRRGNGEAARAILEQNPPVQAGDYAYYYELARACDKANDADAAMAALALAHARHADELRHAAPRSFGPAAPAMPGDIHTVS
ncbi:MAG: tetratricopeptide repeat protein, partial [Proteobacteria bacterium]|nr:tetratricopeptide repeat protein [Pseudomonadota bacterium]